MKFQRKIFSISANHIPEAHVAVQQFGPHCIFDFYDWCHKVAILTPP